MKKDIAIDIFLIYSSGVTNADANKHTPRKLIKSSIESGMETNEARNTPPRNARQEI